jgi:MFS transporter (putative signal transducer)
MPDDADFPGATPGDRQALPLWRILPSIGGIYVAQSLVGGLTFMGIPAVLRAQGVPLEQVGLVSLLMLPWALKFLWAPLAERWRIRPDGRRRTRQMVATGQMLCALGLAALALAGADVGRVMFGILALTALAAATVDIAVDAFAVEQLAVADRGWGNTAQVGGGYLGMVLGGGVFLALVPQLGWNVAAGLMAATVLLLALPLVFGAEPARPALANIPHRPSLAYAFARPEVRRGLLVTVLFEAGVRLVQPLAGPVLVDHGLDLSLIGLVNGAGAVGAGLLGTLIGGLAVRRMGAERAVLMAATAQVTAILALAGALMTGVGPLVLAGLVVAMTFAMAMGFVCLYALLMGLSSLRQAGVDFTLFQCADAAIAGLAGYGAALVAGRIGYGPSFLAAAAIAALGVLAIRLLRGGPHSLLPETKA